MSEEIPNLENYQRLASSIVISLANEYRNALKLWKNAESEQRKETLRYQALSLERELRSDYMYVLSMEQNEKIIEMIKKEVGV